MKDNAQVWLARRLGQGVWERNLCAARHDHTNFQFCPFSGSGASSCFSSWTHGIGSADNYLLSACRQGPFGIWHDPYWSMNSATQIQSCMLPSPNHQRPASCPSYQATHPRTAPSPFCFHNPAFAALWRAFFCFFSDHPSTATSSRNKRHDDDSKRCGKTGRRCRIWPLPVMQDHRLRRGLCWDQVRTVQRTHRS